MKILIFNWRDPKHSWAGGGEIYIFEQASRWIKMGHEVSVFCGEDIENKLPNYEEIDKIRIYRKGNRFTLYFWAMWLYLKEFRKSADIIVDVVNGIPFFTPLFCSKPKVCIVYHIHNKQFFYEIPFPLNYIGFFIEKFIFPLIYSKLPVIAISKTTKLQLIKYGFSPKNIYIVYCGINVNRSSAKLKATKYKHPTLLYLGRIKKYKRVDMLVNIFPAIVRIVPKAKLIIAGWGTEASIITDKVMKSPYRRKISLMGPVSNTEKKELLSKSWAFINPSIGEGWSIAVIEANLYGTPAIAFKVTGLSESIQNKLTGILVRNENELIKEATNLLKDKKTCMKLGKNAYQRAKTFSWDIAANNSLKVFNKILG